MPIGATIGGAVIGAGASIVGGGMAADAQKDAAAAAGAQSAAASAANIKLLKETRAQNLQIASPFYNNGLLASNALNDLLLGTNTYNPAIASNPNVPGGGTLSGFQSGSTDPRNTYEGPSMAEINAMRDDGIPGNYQAALAAYRAGGGAQSGGAMTAEERRARRQGTATPTPAPTPTPTTPATGTPAPTSALSAFDRFRNSTNYQFRLNEGIRGLDSSAAARGMGDSGAARLALLRYGQNYASNELGNYMNLLAGQQNVGLTAGNAVMGVGTSSANAIAAQNTSASNAAANVALANGQATASQWGSIANGVGQIGGALSQYGMQQAFRPPPTPMALPSTPPIYSNTSPGGFTYSSFS